MKNNMHYWESSDDRYIGWDERLTDEEQEEWDQWCWERHMEYLTGMDEELNDE